jgi:hypothetical protein
VTSAYYEASFNAICLILGLPIFRLFMIQCSPQSVVLNLVSLIRMRDYYIKQYVKPVSVHFDFIKFMLYIFIVAVNILNKQSRTADKGWSSNLGVRRGANNSSP